VGLRVGGPTRQISRRRASLPYGSLDFNYKPQNSRDFRVGQSLILPIEDRKAALAKHQNPTAQPGTASQIEFWLIHFI
jgi:hypothetical protein